MNGNVYQFLTSYQSSKFPLFSKITTLKPYCPYFLHYCIAMIISETILHRTSKCWGGGASH